MPFKKNTAVTGLTFNLIATDGSDVTSGTTNGFVTLDGGTQGAIVGASTHKGNGQWAIDLTAAEMNGDIVGLTFTNSSAVTASHTIPTYTEIDVNLLTINGATLPVDNLESQYDGTGITGDNFPFTQEQGANISSGAGGISTVADSVVITTGSEVGTYADTFALDGTYHIVNDAASVTDFYYESDVGTNGVLTEILWEGYAQGNNDTVNIYGYNWVSTAWVQIGTIDGTSGTTDQSKSLVATNGMTGTEANNGKVRIRFESANSSAIATDRILFEYTAITESAFILHSGTAQGGGANYIDLDATASTTDGAYVNSRVITTFGTGAEQENIITDYNGTNKRATVKSNWVIATPDATTGYNITPAQSHAATTAGGYDGGKVYIDGVDGSAGSQIGVNGTVSNRSNNLSDARTIADNQNIKTFDFRGGFAFSLEQGYQNFVFEMLQGQLLDLNGQDVSGAVFLRTGITGVMISTARTIFERCGVIDSSLDVCNLLNSGIRGTITLTDTDRYLFDRCFENAADTPILDVNGDNITPTIVELTGYQGRISISNLTSVDVIFMSGNIHIELDASCNGGTIYRSGDVLTIDNSTVSPTFTGGVINEIDSNTADIPTTTEFNARTLVSDDYFNPTTDAVANVTLVATTTANTDMRGTDSALLAASYTAPDNATITTIDGKVDALTTLVNDVPTTAEFNARTLPSASYSQFDFSTDDVTINATSVNAIFAGGSIDGYSLEESQRLILSASAGKLSGAATSTIIIRDAADTKARITATVDVDGNRANTVLDAT